MLAVERPMREAYNVNLWWKHIARERFWLEITDRDPLGEPVIGAYEGPSGNRLWHGELIRYIEPGDVVFHYYTPWQAIVGWSTAVGAVRKTTLRWTPRSPGGRGGPALKLPAWTIDLTDYTELNESEFVTLEEMRGDEASLRAIRADLESQHGKPVYFPLAFSDKRELRPAQAYLAKLPMDFVAFYGSLHAAG